MYINGLTVITSKMLMSRGAYLGNYWQKRCQEALMLDCNPLKKNCARNKLFSLLKNQCS